jgi:endoglucanase
MKSRRLHGCRIFLCILAVAGCSTAGMIENMYMAKSDVMVFHIWERGLTAAMIAELIKPSNYAITSTDDASYTASKTPLHIKQKRKIKNQNAKGTPATYGTCLELWISLQLPSGLASQKTYTVKMTHPSVVANIGKAEMTFVFDENKMYSEAVQVNTVGYATWGKKYGYVSQWLGEMGTLAYQNGTQFSLINTSTGQPVFSGTLNERTGGTGVYKRRIWEADFSSFTTAGMYRLAVKGVGCSYPFEIHKDAYRTAFHAVARGLFHQRSGIEFTEKNTLWTMPRAHHSDDVPTWQTTVSEADGAEDPARMAANKTAERVDATGGWFDAGDWDKYNVHKHIPFMLFAAYELNPDAFADGELNIPESGNGIPDILDEARWGIEAWRRLQKSDGRVPEYVTPIPANSKLHNPTEILVTTTSPEATALYAGLAAGMGYFLNKFNKTAEATSYINAAKLAYGKGGGNNQMAMAALWLWRATGESSYHDKFKQLNPGFPNVWNEWDALTTYIAANYVLAPNADASIVNAIKSQIVSKANSQISGIDGDAMRAHHEGNWMGAYSHPRTMALPLAYKLTGETRYREYHALNCDYYLGGNPYNMTWITGLGAKSPTNLLNEIFLQYFSLKGLPIQEGLVPYGPSDMANSGQSWCMGLGSGINACFPTFTQWSNTELWFEAPGFVCTNEYTVHQVQGPAIFAYAALVDRDVSRKVTGRSVKGTQTTLGSQNKHSASPWFSVQILGRSVQVTTPEKAGVALYNVAGKQLGAVSGMRHHTLNIDALASGAYIVKVSDGTRTGSHRFTFSALR